jgi:hypothetical protein
MTFFGQTQAPPTEINAHDSDTLCKMPPRKPSVNLPRVKTDTLSDGRIGVTGNTFDIKDRLKAAGGRWHAVDKVWYLPAGTDLAFLKDPLPPPPPEWELQGLCCAEAKRYGYDFRRNEVFCRAHGLKPWWFCCSEAKVISAARQSCSCAVHTQSDPHVACILVRGQRYTGD